MKKQKKRYKRSFGPFRIRYANNNTLRSRIRLADVYFKTARWTSLARCYFIVGVVLWVCETLNQMGTSWSCKRVNVYMRCEPGIYLACPCTPRICRLIATSNCAEAPHPSNVQDGFVLLSHRILSREPGAIKIPETSLYVAGRAGWLPLYPVLKCKLVQENCKIF